MEQKQNPTPNTTAPKMDSKKSSMRMWVLFIVIVILIGGFFIYKGSQEDGFGDGGVIASRLQNDGEELVLGEVTLPDGGGYVVVYERQVDGSRTVFGSSGLLAGGTNKDVVVKKTTTSSGGKCKNSKCVAVVHQDDGDGIFDEETDTPYLDEDGEEITADIELEEEALDDDSDDDSVDDVIEDDDSDTEDADDDVEVMVVPEGATVVSYTNDGFDPNPITVAQGNTVYFTNNSNHGLWVSDGSACGEGNLNSCVALEIGNSWSFTFSEVGEFTFSNEVKPEETGTVLVEEVVVNEDPAPEEGTGEEPGA